MYGRMTWFGMLIGSCLLAGACGGASESEDEGSPFAATTGDEAPEQTTEPAAPAGPRSTGTWVVGGEPFQAESALVFERNGGWRVVLAAPAVDCTFAREGGVPPEGLRRIIIDLPSWEPGVAVTSSAGAVEGQINFHYEGPSPFDPEAEPSPQQMIMNGTTTPGASAPSPGAVATVTLATADEARTNVAEGEIDLTLCE